MDPQLQSFLHNAYKQIDEILMEKLHLVGIYKDDVFNPALATVLHLKKAIVYETPTEVHEEYSAKGITLFNVIWKQGEIIIFDTSIDETTLDRS
jgi:hypothetical protein